MNAEVTKVNSEILSTLVIELKDISLALEAHEVYRLGLFLTGHCWGEGPGNIRYMGKLDKKIRISHVNAAVPPVVIQEYYAESSGVDSDLIKFIISPMLNPIVVYKKDLIDAITGYFVKMNYPPIPFPINSNHCVNQRDEVRIPIPDTTDGSYLLIEDRYMSIVNLAGTVLVPGIFYGNQSMTRPDTVRLLALGNFRHNSDC